MVDMDVKSVAQSKYFDRTFGFDAVKVLPGEYFYTGQKLMITTLLGSCVAACIRDRVRGIGGMNHFLLPGNSADSDSPVSESMRYGSYAMEVLINDLLKAGARRENLEAKVFGGGNVLPGMTSINVGARNARFVLNYLKTDNIPVLVEDLLDIYPRKVCFFPHDGKVMVRKLKQSVDSTIITRESEYQRSLKTRIEKQPVSGDIDLF
ncbi:chemoreceptor glutamine deamidase CheD [Malikia sp.]|uniref:chemoreceptor glutamine deamidase CheD n=1 Tax=Malikia sp. TaxID=2070706 RepID=UPI002629866B|nr:chemoreceptor glutamine deamidase CheD [Malikia sp.]MDD2727909.1 chemoreceptor glutamine deamidase CheD [Malikia sp.]